MNSITSTNLDFPVLEKRFVSSVTSSMLFILAGLVVLTVVVSSENAALNISALLVLAWPVSLFVLSLPSVKSQRKTKTEVSASAAHSNKGESGEYFPSWLGSKAYNAACADSQ